MLALADGSAVGSHELTRERLVSATVGRSEEEGASGWLLAAGADDISGTGETAVGGALLVSCLVALLLVDFLLAEPAAAVVVALLAAEDVDDAVAM